MTSKHSRLQRCDPEVPPKICVMFINIGAGWPLVFFTWGMSVTEVFTLGFHIYSALCTTAVPGPCELRVAFLLAQSIHPWAVCNMVLCRRRLPCFSSIRPSLGEHAQTASQFAPSLDSTYLLARHASWRFFLFFQFHRFRHYVGGWRGGLLSAIRKLGTCRGRCLDPSEPWLFDHQKP